MIEVIKCPNCDGMIDLSQSKKFETVECITCSNSFHIQNRGTDT